MIKTIVIDDEKKSVSTLTMLINEYCSNLEIVGTANSVIEAIKEINMKNPDLIFLDIEMPYATGFDLLESIPERNFDVIFITAFDHYAVKAFKYCAVDYILKPIDIEELVASVDRFVKRKNKSSSQFPDYDLLLEKIKSQNQTKIAVPLSDGLEYLNTEDIIRVEADRSYSTIYLVNKKTIVVCKNLSDFQSILNDKFFRIHKSHIVNLVHIKRLSRSDSGYVEMSDGSKIVISRRRKEDFEIAMRNFSSSF